MKPHGFTSTTARGHKLHKTKVCQENLGGTAPPLPGPYCCTFPSQVVRIYAAMCQVRLRVRHRVGETGPHGWQRILDSYQQLLWVNQPGRLYNLLLIISYNSNPDVFAWPFGKVFVVIGEEKKL